MASDAVIGLLVVDVAVRDSLQYLLEVEDLAFVRVYETAEALLADGNTGFACLIIDYHLPGTDGLNVVARLRLGGSRAAAIVMAALPSKRILLRARDDGVLMVDDRCDPRTFIDHVRAAVGT